jgi:hypothetical protein
MCIELRVADEMKDCGDAYMRMQNAPVARSADDKVVKVGI